MVEIQQRARIRSIDIARGVVMVLMAIDHVRVYAAIPAGGTTTGLFLTRWITHFCAPAFAFLAGASILLQAEKRGVRGLSRHVLARGVGLVVLELTILRVAWTFNFDFSHYVLGGVIWMLGWCMVLMALLVRLPVAYNAAIGLTIIAGHNAAAGFFRDSQQQLLQSGWSWLWRILYYGGGVDLTGGGEPNFFVLYSLVPWIGVMAAGYAFGTILLMEPEKRDARCYAIGGIAMAIFVFLRYFSTYGDWPWEADSRVPQWMAFLNTTKYPASFLFVLMTLGPTIILMPWFERSRGAVGEWFAVFGRVPLFYYLLHIPLIHLMAIGVSLIRSPQSTGWLFNHFPLLPGRAPEGYVWSLGLLYAVTAAVVTMLYFACRWYAGRRLGGANRVAMSK